MTVNRAAGRPDDERLRRATIRRFIRDNHPDRGGDPDRFAAGLRALRATPRLSGGCDDAPGSGPGNVAGGGPTAYRKRGGIAATAALVRQAARHSARKFRVGASRIQLGNPIRPIRAGRRRRAQ